MIANIRAMTENNNRKQATYEIQTRSNALSLSLSHFLYFQNVWCLFFMFTHFYFYTFSCVFRRLIFVFSGGSACAFGFI